MPREGWAERQIENTMKNISQWPAWMRRAAGLKEPKERPSHDETLEKLRYIAARLQSIDESLTETRRDLLHIILSW